MNTKKYVFGIIVALTVGFICLSLYKGRTMSRGPSDEEIRKQVEQEVKAGFKKLGEEMQN